MQTAALRSVSFDDQASDTVENKITVRLSTVNVTLANCKHVFLYNRDLRNLKNICFTDVEIIENLQL